MIIRQIFISLLIVGSILCNVATENGSIVDASALKAHQGHHQGHQGHQDPKHGNTEDDCDKQCVKKEGVALVFGNSMPTPISHGRHVWKDGKLSCECEFDPRRHFFKYLESHKGITREEFLERHQKDPAKTREWLKQKGVTVFFLPDEEELISYLVEVRHDHESLKEKFSHKKIQEIEKRLTAIGKEKGQSPSSAADEKFWKQREETQALLNDLKEKSTATTPTAAVASGVTTTTDPKHGNAEDDCDKQCVKKEGVALVFGNSIPTPISHGRRVRKDGKPSCECEFDPRRLFFQYLESRKGITHEEFLERHQKDPAKTREWLKQKGVTVFFLPDEEELISYLVEVRHNHESLKEKFSHTKIQEIEKRLTAIGKEKGQSPSSGEDHVKQTPSSPEKNRRPSRLRFFSSKHKTENTSPSSEHGGRASSPTKSKPASPEPDQNKHSSSSLEGEAEHMPMYKRFIRSKRGNSK